MDKLINMSILRFPHQGVLIATSLLLSSALSVSNTFAQNKNVVIENKGAKTIVDYTV